MNYTDNYGLKLPTFSDSANISALNENFSAIDEEIFEAKRIANQNKTTVDSAMSSTSTNPVQNKVVKKYVDEQISNINITNENEVPSYWQSALDKGADNIHRAMESAGRNKSSFLFYSDAHWDNGSQMSPKLLKYLYKNTAMTKTFFGGDIVNSESTNRDTMEYLYEWREMVKDLPNHHSVVGNHDDGNHNTDNPPHNSVFDENYVYAYLLAPEETPNMVMGEGFYYYIDEPCEKTRYLFLDTAYQDQFTLSTAQSTFIQDALDNAPENWHIVVISHIWYMPDYENNYEITGLSNTAYAITNILDGYNAREDRKAKVEFCIGGHVHYDYVGTTTGGIPIILVETDSYHTRGDFAVTTDETTKSSVNGIVCDYNTNKINVIRVGRGNSRVVDLKTGEVIEIPKEEEPETPEEPDTPTYTNVLDTVGYTTGRLNSSGQIDTSRTDRYTTGFIPCKSGDIIYLKNITAPETTSGGSSQCACYTSNSEDAFIDGTSYGMSGYTNPVVENGNIVQFTVSYFSTAVSYIRISAQYIDKNSIITVNQEIK